MQPGYVPVQRKAMLGTCDLMPCGFKAFQLAPGGLKQNRWLQGKPA